MKKATYSKILMAPLFMLLAVACSPNQFNQSTEYDDVYFSASDRQTVAVEKQKARTATLETQARTANLENYSSDQLDETIVTKYNNGTNNVVTYYEEGPLVQSARDLNYDDFVADYNNENLAYYELPLDWQTDWDRVSFNSVMERDFHFRLAWYDQYYRGQNIRMSQYLSGNFGGVSRRNTLGGPRIGLSVGFNNVGFGFNNMAFVDINPWGFYDPFFSPINTGFGWGGGWNRWNRWNNWNAWNDPFFCPPLSVWNWRGGWGWRGGWRNNVFVNNNIFIDRRGDRFIAGNNRSGDVRRGPRVNTRSVATVRNESVNGTAPSTRSSRYVDNLEGNRSNNVRSRSGRANTGRANVGNSASTRSSSTVSNGRNSNNQVRTGAYRYENSGRSSRSSYVRNYNSSGRSSGSQTRASSSSRNGSRSGYSSSSRNSSSRGYSNGRSSSSSSSSRSAYSRGSSSRNSSGSRSYSRGSSSSRSSGSARSRSSSSRSSSGSRSSGSARSSNSRSSSGSRSSGSARSSSSRSSSGSRSSSSRSSGSSRSGRGN